MEIAVEITVAGLLLILNVAMVWVAYRMFTAVLRIEEHTKQAAALLATHGMQLASLISETREGHELTAEAVVTLVERVVE